MYIYIYIYKEREIYDDHSSPGPWSAGVLNHVCLGLKPSNGREWRCLRARGPLDHLYSRPLGRDVFIIQYTTINICMYIYIYIERERERDRERERERERDIDDDHSSPGLWSAGMLNHVCLGLEPSNGRERMCLRARGPLDHLYSRPLGRDVFIIQYTTINICMYIYVYI